MSYLKSTELLGALNAVPRVLGPYPAKGWYELSVEQQIEANIHAMENSVTIDGLFGREELQQFFRIEACESYDSGSFPIGSGKVKQWFRIASNPHNRPVKEKGRDTYKRDMVSQPGWRADGQVVSMYLGQDLSWLIGTGQHRIQAGWQAVNEAPELLIPLSIRVGVPRCYADTYDTQIRFSGNDLASKHIGSIFTPEPIFTTNEAGETVPLVVDGVAQSGIAVGLEGEDHPERVKGLTADYGTTLRGLLARMKGQQGIRGSGQTDKVALVGSGEYATISQCVADTVQWVTRMAYGHKGANKLVSIPIPHVALILLLVANRDLELGDDGLPTAPLTCPDTDETAVAILDQLLTDNPPYGVFASALDVIPVKGTKGGITVSADRRFNILCHAVQTFLDDGTPHRVTLGQASSKWDMKVAETTESGQIVMVPNAKFKSYPYLGGIDIGYVRRKATTTTEQASE